MSERESKDSMLYTVRRYPCGCEAAGPGDVPAYCGTHDVSLPAKIDRLRDLNANPLPDPVPPQSYTVGVPCGHCVEAFEKLRAENERLSALLKVARCPNGNCDGHGTIQLSDFAGDIEQCQWCYEAGHIPSFDAGPAAETAAAKEE